MRNHYRDDDDTKERLRQAALLSMGVTGTLAAGQSVPRILKDVAENRAVKKSTSWRAFVEKLEPGDVMFSRLPRKYSPKVKYGNQKELPITQQDLMNAVKGDPYYHAGVYGGHGNTYEASGFGEKLKSGKLKKKGAPQDFRVYRASKAEAAQGVKNMKKGLGASYPESLDIAKHGLQHLAGVTKKTTGTCGGKSGITCTESVAEAFPKIFKDRLASPAAMRSAEGLELVARHGASAPKMRELLLSRLVHPILKNAKWGLLAGGLGLGAMALKGHDNEQAERS